MKPEDLAAVRRLNIFAHICNDTFEGLMNASFLQRFSRGITIIRQNDIADFLYILIRGKVEVFATVNGRETTLDIVEPVGLFILAAVFNHNVCMQSARILADSLALMIPAECVRNAVENDNLFMRAVVSELSNCYNKTVSELKNHKLRTSGERLANWLLMLNNAQKKGGYVQLPVEKRLLASHLGMTPENLSRAFSSLSQHGIKVSGPRIVFVDMKKFLQFAKPDPLSDKD